MYKLHFFIHPETARPNCNQVQKMLNELLKDETLSNNFEIEKHDLISDLAVEYGIMIVPTLILDDEVLIMGNPPAPAILKKSLLEFLKKQGAVESA
jgi:predicted thioredoxin/glutaredoxin